MANVLPLDEYIFRFLIYVLLADLELAMYFEAGFKEISWLLLP